MPSASAEEFAELKRQLDLLTPHGHDYVRGWLMSAHPDTARTAIEAALRHETYRKEPPERSPDDP